MSRSADIPPKLGPKDHLYRASVLASITVLVCSIAYGQAGNAKTPDHALADAYAEHLVRVQRALPPHSALPPVLDLSKPNKDDPGAGKKWEDRFTGSMGVRPIDYDPGTPTKDEATSISVTTTENAGQIPLLPARSCDLVAIAKPIDVSAHLAYNRRFVYSVFNLELLELFKGQSGRDFKRRTHITAAQLGGSIRFRSGHEAAFLEANDGFMALDKQYLLFLWKPVRSSETYMVAEAYLLQDGRVLPIILGTGEAHYTGKPIPAFIRKVKAVIAKNVDAM